MKYAFVRDYAPSYDHFLTSYFKKAGIAFDENTSFEEAEGIANEIKKKGYALTTPAELSGRPLAFIDVLPAHEALFWRYVYHWGAHPGARPAVYSLMRLAVGLAAVPNLKEMRALESQLPSRNGKMVFSEDEIASQIADFYRRQFADPLRKALSDGAVPPTIMNYFSLDELRRLPDSALVGRETFETSVEDVADELLAWLITITPERVQAEIGQVLKAHEGTPEHMREVIDKLGSKTRRTKVCEHILSSITLRGDQEFEETECSLLLSPSRVSPTSSEDKSENWNDVFYPTYWSLPEQW